MQQTKTTPFILQERENSFHAKTRKQWRNWLIKNHETKDSVWLIVYKKQCGVASIYYPEAVDEALCFGWIDSVGNKRDENSYYQFFSKRKPKSNWSKVNKLKVAKLVEEGLMYPKGMEMVELAKQTGTWTKLEEVDELKIPADLQQLFSANNTALQNWNKFPQSAKRGILEWILNAKREETRLKRIVETVELATINKRANQWPKG